MKPATQVIHAGRHPRDQGDPLASAVTFAGTYAASGDPAKVKYNYGRYHNPTWSAFEQALGELEGGSVHCFASGMAAITAVLSAALQPGDVIVLPEDSYYTMRLLAEGIFSRMGVTIRKAPTAKNKQLSLIQRAKLLWLETPLNPGLAVCDLAAAVGAARRHGMLVAVDNTTATVLGQNPLAFGADFSVSSDTKALTATRILCLAMSRYATQHGVRSCKHFET